jgi:hypothetical protein
MVSLAQRVRRVALQHYKKDRSTLSFDPEALDGRLSTGSIP